MEQQQGAGGTGVRARFASMSLTWGFLKPGQLSGWLQETAAAGV